MDIQDYRYFQVVVALEKTTNVTDHTGAPKIKKWTETYLIEAANPELAAEHVKQNLLSTGEPNSILVKNDYYNPDIAKEGSDYRQTYPSKHGPYDEYIYRFDTVQDTDGAKIYGFTEDKIWVVQVKKSPILDVMSCSKEEKDSYLDHAGV